MKNRTLMQILEENYSRATVLEIFGIDYTLHLGKTLSGISETYGIDQKVLTDALEQVRQVPVDFHYDFLDIPVLVAYLKHTHHEYARTKIPHISKNLQRSNAADALNLAFEKFSRDLKKHMLLEEKVIFPFIVQLFETNEDFDATRARKLLEENSTDILCASHTQDDDEMKELRELTGNFSFEKEDSISFKIAITDLKSLEKDIHLHARIEDTILFQKAKMAEAQLRERIRINDRNN